MQDQIDLTERGAPGDRRFHLINERGHLTNAKRVGSLQQVEADWDEDAARLTLRFPDGSTVSEEVRTDGEVTTSFYGRPVDGRFVTGPFSAALSEFTGTELRLVQPTEAGSGIDRGGEGAVTMLTEAALGSLAQQAGVSELDGRRFRMLFGISGADAHTEDEWIGRRVRVGDAVVIPRGHVGRCLITSRHPESGKIDVDTLKALARYRKDLDTTEQLAFGVFGEVAEPGHVRIGDPVEPL
jgi:uncharacterized protein YcbX